MSAPMTDLVCAFCGDDDPADCERHDLCCDPCHDAEGVAS